MGEILHLGSPPQQWAPARLAAVVAGNISGGGQLLQFEEDAAHHRFKRIECERIDFVYGTNNGPAEKPAREVTVQSFAMSLHHVFNREWDEYAAAKACDFAAVVDDDDISLKRRRS